MALAWHEGGAEYVLEKGVEALTLKVMLLNGSFVHAKTDTTVSDIVANELSGGGYVRTLIANVTVTAGANSRLAVIDHDDVEFVLDGVTIGGIAIIAELATDATSRIILSEAIADQVTNGGTFTVRPDASDGIAYAYTP